MGRTVFYTATSLDGFLATEDHSLDWLLSQPLSESTQAEMEGLTTRFGAQLMGASTYLWVVEHEDLVAHPERWPYSAPTWVMTHRDLPRLPGADVRFAQGEVADVHAEMVAVAGDADRWVVGGGDLAGQLADAGLLDELEVTIAPVTLGGGAPLLPRRLDLTVCEVRHTAPFVTVRYRVEKA